MSLEINYKCELPAKLAFLVEEKARYKIAWGGRGSAKSWSYARALVDKSLKERLRIICVREYQTSIEESVHHLLEAQIHMLGVQDVFTVQKTTIRNVRGSEFIFFGIASDPNKIKSLEGADICWVEEAENVSDKSWETLIPTVRRPGSEIWASFNPPETHAAPTYQRFVIDPPKDAIVTKVSFYDNPWFPEVLEQERLELKRKDPRRYRHVWLGEVIISGSPYFPPEALEIMESYIRPPVDVGVLELKPGGGVKFMPQSNGWLQIYEWPDDEENYVCGLDVSEMLPHGDLNSGHILKRGMVPEQVARFVPQMNPKRLAEPTVLTCMFYGGAVNLGIERNNHGLATVLEVEDMDYEYQYRMPVAEGSDKAKQSPRIGWLTNKETRKLLCSDMLSASRDTTIRVRARETLSQMETFIVTDKGKPEAAPGCKDDDVIGIGIALQMALRTEPPIVVGKSKWNQGPVFRAGWQG